MGVRRLCLVLLGCFGSCAFVSSCAGDSVDRALRTRTALCIFLSATNALRPTPAVGCFSHAYNLFFFLFCWRRAGRQHRRSLCASELLYRHRASFACGCGATQRSLHFLRPISAGLTSFSAFILLTGYLSLSLSFRESFRGTFRESVSTVVRPTPAAEVAGRGLGGPHGRLDCYWCCWCCSCR